jgi:hypothetical protein
MKKALSLGAKSPLIASFGAKQYHQVHLVTLLSALETTYVVNKKKIREVCFTEYFSHYKFEKINRNRRIKLND